MSELRQPPTYSDHCLGVFNASRFQRDPLGFLMGLAKEHDDLVCFRLGPFQACLLISPATLREFFVDQRDAFAKLGRHTKVMRTLEGDSLFLSEGGDWLRRRRILNSAFQERRMPHYSNQIVDLACRRVDAWQSGRSLDIADEMTELTLAILGKTLFSVELEGQLEVLREIAKVRSATLISELGSVMPLPDWLPIPRKKRKRRMIARYRDWIDNQIGQRRSGGNGRDDFLSVLLHAVDSEGDRRGLTDEQARDEATLLFTAGFDDVATALAWILYLVATSRETDRRIADELHEVLGNEPPGYEDVSRLPYLGSVIHEALRLYPPTWCLAFREATRNVHLAGFEIAAGTWTIVSPYVAHRLPENFTNPEIFDPDRFSPDRMAEVQKFSYIPFAGGPRKCIGASLGMAELMLVAAVVLQRTQLEIAPEQGEIVLDPLLTLRPRGGIRMICRSRRRRD